MTGDDAAARLYIGVKAPRAGFVKTRLGRTIGDPAAAALYAAFLTDLAARLEGRSRRTAWFVTPDDSWGEVADHVGHDWAEPVGQGEGDWGVRQDRLFQRLPHLGPGGMVLIGSDSPQVSLASIEEAFSALETHPLVFGPVDDGGYWLIGMRSYVPLLAEVRMSTPGVLGHLLSRAAELGLPAHLLEPTFDVDEVTDLERLGRLARSRVDLAATRAAMEALGLTT